MLKRHNDMTDRYFKLPATNGAASAEQSPPDDLVAPDGRIQAGVFSQPVSSFGFERAKALGGKLRGLTGLPRLVEWYGAGMAHPDYYFGLIVVQAQVLSFATLYGYDRRTQAYFSHDNIGRAARGSVSPSPWAGTTRYAARGFEIRIDHDLARGQHRVSIDIAARRKRPRVVGELIWHENLSASPALAALVPMGGKHFIYNHKAQMPIEGTLNVNGQPCVFSPRRDLANMDEVRAHMGPGRYGYVWFNFSGIDTNGDIVGFNAATIGKPNAALAAENVVWAGPELTHVGEIAFDVDPNNLLRPWRARDNSGRVDLTFRPEGGKSVRVGPFVKYFQKCGSYSGTLTDRRGRVHVVRDYVGCAEFARVLS